MSNYTPTVDFLQEEELDNVTEKGDVVKISIMTDYRVKKYIRVNNNKVSVNLPKECKSVKGAQMVAGNAMLQNYLSERAIEHLQFFLRKYEDKLRQLSEDKEQLEKDFAEFWDEYEQIKGLK